MQVFKQWCEFAQMPATISFSIVVVTRKQFLDICSKVSNLIDI